jgi:hypothetical protein
MTNQPNWQCIANLGDTDPLTYGGAFVVIDTAGVYPPELHIWEEPTGEEAESAFDWPELGDGAPYQVVPEDTRQYDRFTVILDQCTYINGILSDNKYHPEHPAWFAYNPGDLPGIANSMDVSVIELIHLFCSEDPIERAVAYKMVYDYWGPQSEPSQFSYEEAKERITQYLNQIKGLE